MPLIDNFFAVCLRRSYGISWLIDLMIARFMIACLIDLMIAWLIYLMIWWMIDLMIDWFFSLRSEADLQQWVQAIASTLPPPPQPPGKSHHELD